MTDLESLYSERYSRLLVGMAGRLERKLASYFDGQRRIDRVSARAKSIVSFLEKAERQESPTALKYREPLSDIQDQLGARVVVFYPRDIEPASQIIEKYFRPIERQVKAPESEREFDYSGKHYILFVPPDIMPEGGNSSEAPSVFELQIKTLFEHAWSEANHDLGFKPETPLPPGARRKLAFAAAQAWGADQIFNELSGLHSEGDS